MNKQLVVCLFLLGTCLCLDIAINSQDYRCMVVYSVNEDEHLKINIKFPKLKVQDNKSYY